jgi:hypothetical protein
VMIAAIYARKSTDQSLPDEKKAVTHPLDSLASTAPLGLSWLRRVKNLAVTRR